MEPALTLFDIVRTFSDENTCIETLSALRWPGGVRCGFCSAPRPLWSERSHVWRCQECRKQFGVKTGTIFENTALPLGKWLVAAWMFVEWNGRVGPWELQRTIGVRREVATSMLKRLRAGAKEKSFGFAPERFIATANLLDVGRLTSVDRC